MTRMSDWVAEWFGRAFLGALVEWVSDVRHPIVDRNGLEQGDEAASRLEAVQWEITWSLLRHLTFSSLSRSNAGNSTA